MADEPQAPGESGDAMLLEDQPPEQMAEIEPPHHQPPEPPPTVETEHSFVATAEAEPWLDENFDERRHSHDHSHWDSDSDEGQGTDESEEDDKEEEEDEYGSSEEEEDDEEEETEEEEEEEEMEPEEDEEIVNLKHELINSYLLKKGLLKYLRKRNAYFQDRIYRTSVRKGMIVEADMKKQNKKSRKSHRKKDKDRKEKEDAEAAAAADKTPEGLEAVLAAAAAATGGGEQTPKKKKSLDRVALPSGGAAAALAKKQGKLHKAFGETFSNEVKYQKVVRKIILILQDQKVYEEQHLVNLEKHALRREEWREAHRKQLLSILAKIRNASEEAIDSNTGRRMLRWETEQFCSEIIAIHTKLCNTMVKMYKCRRGLELSTKRLDESEVQGEGLQMLEFEQLSSENQTLNDKLSDRYKDVDNMKEKITHGIQILAHFRAKMFCVNQQISEGKTVLGTINVDVYASREKTEQTVKRYERVKRDEQKLVVESGLLDNATLLRDYEKTHFEVMALKEEKRKMLRELDRGLREIGETRERISEIQAEYPMLFASAQELEKHHKAEVRRKTLFGSTTKLEDAGVKGVGGSRPPTATAPKQQ